MKLILFTTIIFIVTHSSAISRADYVPDQDTVLDEAPKEVIEAGRLVDNYKRLSVIISDAKSSNNLPKDLKSALKITSELFKEKYEKASKENQKNNGCFLDCLLRKKKKKQVDSGEMSDKLQELEALDLFNSISDALGDKSCSYDSYLILAKNYKAVLGDEERILTARSEIMIDVYGAILKHSDKCSESYVGKFVAIYSGMKGKISTRNVERILDRRILMNTFGDLSSVNLIRAVKIHEKIIGSSRLIGEKLSEVAADSSPDKDSVAVMYLNYLSKPCAYYVDKLQDVFDPARLDLVLNDGPERLHSVFKFKDNFQESFFRFRACQAIVRHSDTVLKSLEDAFNK